MGRTYVVSDVHGHLGDLKDVLAREGLVDDEDRWTGEDTTLWVLGDLVDRGPDGIGVIRFVRDLQAQAPDSVHVLMGNHEALMLGVHLFPETRFSEVWYLNGGRQVDQEQLTDDDVAWLRALPVLARSGEHLLMHSDTQDYLEWGSSVEEVNATVAGLLEEDQAQDHWDVFAALTSRYDFRDSTQSAQRVLEALGGDQIVHGHSIIGTLVDLPSSEIDGPLTYAEGQVLAIDGGRYDGGPLLLVELS